MRRSAWRPEVLVLAALVAMAVAIHFASDFTGPLEMPAPAGPRFEGGDLVTPSRAYPRTAMDRQGYSITLKRPARRIGSLEWSIDEFVYTVAAPETVVAVSESAYEHRISNVYEWAEKYRPAIASNAETVLKAEPDLVLAAARTGSELSDILTAGGIPTYRMFTLFTRLDEVADSILLTGYLTGRNDEARRAHEAFQEAVRRAASRKPKDSPAPRILGFGGKYSYGGETLFNDIVKTVGGVNVGAEHGLRGYDPINTEQVLRWNPEWIVSGAGRGTSDQVLRRFMEDPAIRLTTAARRGQIVIFEHNVFLAMSPFTTLILDALSETLYSTKP